MSGTVIAQQQLTGRESSITPAYAAAAAAMECPNTAPTLLHVKNGSGASINVTATNQTTQDGVAGANKVVAVAAGTERMIRFDPGTYNMGNGNVQLAFSATATITVAAFTLP
jgi:hypothetical protein